MARKPKFVQSKFYAHYDKKTGEIYSIGNEVSNVYDNRIEITQEDHDKFLYGHEKFSDYLIGYIRTIDNKTVLALAPKADKGYAFKNNIFEWISDIPTKDTELVVTWDKENEWWIFSLSDNCKKRIEDNVTSDVLPFFVMLSNDFDFLIRTIFISMQDLVTFDNIKKPFKSQIEKNIDKISIASTIVFQSYGLKIND